MILGLGMDLVEIPRIRAAYARFGTAFLERVLTPAEIDYSRSHADPVPSLAARFAAKEALAKAFGVGIGASLGWRDIEVVRTPAGRPELQLHGKGIELAAGRGVRRLWLSLTHAPAHAAAVAVLES